MHTLNKMGLAQTTKPHQKGLTTHQLQKGANIPLNPEKGTNYPPPKKKCLSQHISTNDRRGDVFLVHDLIVGLAKVVQPQPEVL